MTAAMLFLSEAYPYSPICLFMVGFPLYIIGIYETAFQPRFKDGLVARRGGAGGRGT